MRHDYQHLIINFPFPIFENPPVSGVTLIINLPSAKYYTVSKILYFDDINLAFKIASEASYVYVLSGQKLIKNAKNCQFWRVFENLKLEVKQCYQTATGHF